MPSQTPTGRRFSKTQRIITYDDGIESGVLNSWINGILTNYNTLNNMTSSNVLMTDPKSSRRSEFNLTKEIMQFEIQINSNDFDAFELHSVTKKNSLYFMMQYAYQKFDFD